MDVKSLLTPIASRWCVSSALAATGAELLFGMTNGAQFSLGGIFTKVLADAVTFRPPIGAGAVRQYLERPRGYRLIRSCRDRSRSNLKAIAAMIERFGALLAAIGPLSSAMNLNPVIAGPSCTLAVDALFISPRNP